MYLKELNIENFGPINKLIIKFSEDKINLILGDNLSGKTNILASVFSLFYDKNILRFHKESKLIAQVSLILNSDNKNIFIKKRYNNAKSDVNGNEKVYHLITN